MIAMAFPMFRFLKSKWLPILLILVAVVIAALYMHQRGYRIGVQVTEIRMYKERSEALSAQLLELNRVNEIDLKAAVRAATLEAGVRTHVESIQIPNLPQIKCDDGAAVAGSAEVGAPAIGLDDLDLSDWLRFFNAAVSAPGTPDPS